MKVTFIQPDGSEQVVETDTGLTLMETAKMNDVPGSRPVRWCLRLRDLSRLR